MDYDNSYFKDRYERFELEDKIDELNKKQKQLADENHNLKKENKYLKSSKAYKLFKSYLKLRNENQDEDIAKSDETKNLKDIKVAIICDQFTYDSYKYEFTPVSLLPDIWRQQFEEERPDLFFCESAWDGHNFEGLYGPWRDKISKDYEASEENRTILFDIIAYCRENSIPTIFWNKEDPPHYRNEKISYAETAKEFDYIFTSSENCIKHYKKDFNHLHVYSLMFAGQPKLFNPLNLSREYIDEIAFAGSYYSNHPKRARMMEDIFDRLLENGQKLLIFNRNYYKNWAAYPERYDEYVNPPIDYTETPILYKKMKWGVNFNIVTDSRTMFARRMFELALSNVNILTNYSLGVDEIFKDNVFFFDKSEELPDFNEGYEEKRMNNLYNILENHTYTKRWKQILDTIGFDYIEDEEYVDVIYRIDSAGDMDSVLDNFDNISYPKKTLKVLVKDKSIDKEKYEGIYDVYHESEINKLKNDINSEFWILLDDKTDSDFIKKAILHYQYLNKRISICEGEDKFSLDRVEGVENKLINKINVDYLTNSQKIDVYYI